MKSTFDTLRNVLCSLWIGLCLFCAEKSEAQSCGNTEEEFASRQSMSSGFSASCIDWADYHVLDEFDTPIKTIRLTFHIFQNAAGTAGLADSPAVRTYINNIVNIINNDRFTNLDLYNKTSTSPHYDDCRIRVYLENIYFWKNDDGWDYKHPGDVGWSSYPGTMWSFIQSQSISYKTTSLHVLSGNRGNHDIGWAAKFGSDQLVFYPDLDDKFAESPSNTWQPATTIAHEVGHTLSLGHPEWRTDCPSTDLNPCSANSCSNNLMNNRACCALTVCQIHLMHDAIWNNYFSIGEYTKSGASSSQKFTPAIDAAACVSTSGDAFSISNYPFGAQPDWTATPSSKLVSSSDCGPSTSLFSNNSNNTGSGSITYNLKYGSTTKSKLTSVVFSGGITGTVNSGGQTQNVQGSGSFDVSSTNVIANIDAPGVSSFTWTKTCGTGTFLTQNNGKKLTLYMLPGGYTCFNVSTNNSTCGALSATITFYHVGNNYAFYPNPTAGDLWIEAIEDKEIQIKDNGGLEFSRYITPGIDKITVVDKEGHFVKDKALPKNTKKAKISLEGLKSGVYFVIVEDDELLVESKIIKN